MGSEGPPVVTVHVTGFKRFHGVAENPTETIVCNLKEFIEKKGLPKGLVLGSCTVLETAGQGALPKLYQILESAAAGRDAESSNSGQVIWIHFGVNSGSTRFAIENQAVNEATFRCPDELGWKPQGVSIVPADGGICRIREVMGPLQSANCSGSMMSLLLWGIGKLLIPGRPGVGDIRLTRDWRRARAPCLLHLSGSAGSTPSSNPLPARYRKYSAGRTCLPVNKITEALTDLGYKVVPSDDAGRFVCNFVYYHSLRFAEQKKMKSLFVHFPLFSTIDKETQMHFAASLLEVLASLS